MVRVLVLSALLLSSCAQASVPWMKSEGPLEPDHTPDPDCAGTPPPASKPSIEELRRLQRGMLLDDPDNDAEKLNLALLELASGDGKEAGRVLAGMESTPLLRKYLEAYLVHQAGESRKSILKLEELARENRGRGAFGLDRLVVAKSVAGFRRYEMGPKEFKPGDVVVIYVEPRNFALRASGEQRVMRLTYSWSLRDDRDREIKVPAWESAAPKDREDQVAFQGEIAEFYQFFKLRLPSNLAAGAYHVRVGVTDEVGGGSDAGGVEIGIVGTNP